MIEPNYVLFMNLLIAYFAFAALALIIAGLGGEEKNTRYGGGDILLGIILLSIIAATLVL